MAPATKRERIVVLGDEGVDPVIIAREVGSTVGAVRTVLAHHRRLVRGVVVSPGAFACLKAEAVEREMKPVELASRVLELVFTDDLLEAVLDE